MKGGRCRCPFIIHLLTQKGYDYAHSHRERHVTWKESQPRDIAEVKKAINKLGFEA